MSSELQVADRLMTNYFKSKALDSPAVISSRLLRRITLDRCGCVTGLPTTEMYALLELALFDVDDLVENFLGIKLFIRNLDGLDERTGAKVLGFAVPKRREIWICERTLDYEPLYRTTCMHEVGHVLMHATSIASHNYAPDSKRRPAYETEVDRFMGRCLLPDNVLHLALVMVAAIHRIRLEQTLRSANTENGRWLWRRRFFPFLVSCLCISREMLALRMLHQGVFNEDTFQFHRSYAMPNRWNNDQMPTLRVDRGKKDLRNVFNIGEVVDNVALKLNKVPREVALEIESPPMIGCRG